MKTLNKKQYDELDSIDKAKYIAIYQYKTFGGKYRNVTQQCEHINIFKEKFPNCPVRIIYVLNEFNIQGSSIFKADKLILNCFDARLIKEIEVYLNDTEIQITPIM